MNAKSNWFVKFILALKRWFLKAEAVQCRAECDDPSAEGCGDRGVFAI